MANKNLFTKFASLAMAGALAFSAVPVTGLTGAFAATSTARELKLTEAGKNLVWHPTVAVTPSVIAEVNSGNYTLSGTDFTSEDIGLNFTVKKGKVNSGDPQSESNMKLSLNAIGDYELGAFDVNGNYDPETYTVDKLDLGLADDISLTADEVIYNGKHQEAVVEVNTGVTFTKNNAAGYEGENIGQVQSSLGGWYNVPAAGVDVGEYTGTVKAYNMSSNPLEGEKDYKFEIAKFPINASTIGTAVGQTEVTVGQKAKSSSANPTVVVKAHLNDGTGDVTTLEEGTDYSVVYDDISDTVGYATITFSGNYEGEYVAPYTIVDEKYDLANATLTMKDAKGNTVDADHPITYDGTTSTITPTVKATIDGVEKTLADGTDYGVEYEYDDDDTAATKANAGVVTVKVNAKAGSKWGGQLIGQFTIAPMSIEGSSITPEAEKNIVYDGTPKEAGITLKRGTTPLNHNEDGVADDFVVTYEGNVDAGDALAICEGVGNYTGTKSVKFNIAPASMKSDAVDVEEVPNQIYTGEEIKPGVTAKFTDGNNRTVDLVEGTDYTLSYKNNIKSGGTGTVEVAGTGNFEKSVSKTFKIKDAAYDLANATVELANASIPYDGKNHSAVIKSVKVTQADGTVKTLTNGSEYEVKNTVAKEVGKYTATIQAPKNSDYAGYQTVEFEITGYDVNEAGFSLKKTSVKYTGKNQKPELVVADGTRYDGGNMTEGVDYEVSGIKNIKNVGKLTVKVTGLGAYAGTEKSLTFKVTKADQPMKVTAKTATVKYSKVKKANQKVAAKNVVTVKNNQGTVSYKKKSGNSKITVASNGKVTVKKGLKKGTYKVKVQVTAKGNSNYNSGNKTVTFKIKVK